MVKRIFIFIFALLLLPFLSIYAFADEETAVPDEYEELLDEIPDDIAELLPEGIFSDNEDEIANAVIEMTSFEFFLDRFFEVIGLNLPNIIRALGTICSILALSAILNMLKGVFRSSSLSGILSFVSSAIIIASIVELSQSPLQRSMILLEQVKTFVNTMSPLICSMYAMGGNIGSAIVHNYGLLVFLTIFENVCIIALEMILGVCLSLALVSAFMPENGLLGISNAIKKCFTFIVGIFMLIFTTVISTQSLLASRADSLSAKTAKMLASQMIPVVGGTVGESLRTAGASIDYLRSNIGIALIIILGIMILPTVISLVLYRAMFVCSNAVAGLLGCEREGRMILEISSIYGYVLAIISICSVALLFLITLFAKCSSALV